MKNKLTLVIVVLLLMGASGGSVYLYMAQRAPVSKPAVKTEPASDTQKSEDGRKVLYWQAPMNPQEIYDKPGKSKMGMDLVPVYEGEGPKTAKGTVSIDPVTVQNMGVRFAPVKRTNLSTIVRTVGKVDYNEENLYTVTTKFSGWIEKLYVDFTGQLVKKGDPLLRIYSPELVTTQQEYLLALQTNQSVQESPFQSIKSGGQSLLQSTRKRLEYWDIPDSEIKKLEKTGEVQRSILLRAPASGMITHKNAVEGAKIKEGTGVYQIADLSTVWVQASIYDYELPWIQQGQPAEMTLSYLPGRTFRGTVDYIYPNVEEKARSVQVRLRFPNPGLQLKPGMYANVNLQAKEMEDALVIPSEAVIRSGKRNLVFVKRGGGQFEPRDVILGTEGGPQNSLVQVQSGLTEGEEVVTSAQFLLDSESKLQEAIQKMLESKKTAPSTNMQMDMDMKQDSSQTMNSEKSSTSMDASNNTMKMD